MHSLCSEWPTQAALPRCRREPGIGVTAGLGSQPEQDLVRSVLHAANHSSAARQRLAAMQRDTLLKYHTAMVSYAAAVLITTGAGCNRQGVTAEADSWV